MTSEINLNDLSAKQQTSFSDFFQEVFVEEAVLVFVFFAVFEFVENEELMHNYALRPVNIVYHSSIVFWVKFTFLTLRANSDVWI